MDHNLLKLGIYNDTGKVHYNLGPAALVEEALKRGEGVLTDTGALSIKTGKYTGRSPDDKFIVDTPDVHDAIAWGDVNRPMSEKDYTALKEKIMTYLGDKELYVFQGLAGADQKYTRKFMVVNERACQNLFIHQLLIRPSEEELADYGEQDFTILVAPGFRCVPERDNTHSEAAVVVNFSDHMVLIAGTEYSGEIKKSVFTVMNYVMPIEENVLPMHCSANMNPETRGTAVFFGLSGTGKTTLSADPNRLLIGDDEHGWSDNHIFNFEGGCYAKCINLTQDGEPYIYNAIKFGSEVENVVIDPVTRIPDYFDGTLTLNTRVAYPLEYIDNAIIPSVGISPDVVIFLTADAFGVLPPISKLDKNSAMYHFVTGFTSKVAGTERGITEPQPTFSTLFGEPFMPLSPDVYARMLGEKIKKQHVRVYLINTGWTGGPYGVGHRMSLQYTRAMVTSALNGDIEKARMRHDKRFNLLVPQECPEVPHHIMNPRSTWSDRLAYDKQADKLAKMFEDNFNAKYPHMSDEIKNAGPHPLNQ
ncbi:phosphoenolpyruvate carboxykinase (ATP) [Sharpea azabuensis]|uniref:phosphoenolpyruvate carboxykinase (ATP) n=1 Tax=Sharpea azabuensis TaxID=322505 RepID=UPI001566B71A|nr:phosphoenolpyruvate carboxykinase (ATP) [Sharpea azabuensis]